MSPQEQGITPDQGERPEIENTLSERYASTPMVRVFSPEGKVVAGRGLLIAVMKGQAELGLDIPQHAITDYESVRDIVDLDAIRDREKKLRHDEKARLEVWNELAGHEFAGLGMTSREISDNVEQMQIRDGMEIVRDHTVATLSRIARLAVEHETLVYPERSHLAPAQPSLIGKFFSNFGEELLTGLDRLESLIDVYPLRGIKGAVGTQTDQLQLFDGDTEKVDVLEQQVAEFLGFKNVLGSVGQEYPRSLDFEVASRLFQLACGPASFAKTARSMAGFGYFSEGFGENQVGSLAMPHKMNARTAERTNALKQVLAGNMIMLANISGDQSYAGDVSGSATRRVAIPDSFFAIDGILEATMTVLDECEFYPAVIQKEMDSYLPFLTTTRLLMTAVKHGVGREVAHAAIRDHAVAVAVNMRKTGMQENDLLDRLSKDPRLEGVSKETFIAAISNQLEFVGNAPRQITRFASQVEQVVERYPEAAQYSPEPIL